MRYMRMHGEPNNDWVLALLAIGGAAWFARMAASGNWGEIVGTLVLIGLMLLLVLAVSVV